MSPQETATPSDSGATAATPAESLLTLELAEEDRGVLKVLLGGRERDGEHLETVGSRLGVVLKCSVAGVDVAPDGRVLIRLVRGGIAKVAEMLEETGAVEEMPAAA